MRNFRSLEGSAVRRARQAVTDGSEEYPREMFAIRGVYATPASGARRR